MDDEPEGNAVLRLRLTLWCLWCLWSLRRCIFVQLSDDDHMLQDHPFLRSHRLPRWQDLHQAGLLQVGWLILKLISFYQICWLDPNRRLWVWTFGTVFRPDEESQTCLVLTLALTDFAPPWEDTTQTRRTGTRRSGSNFTLNNLHQRDGDGRHDLNLGHAHEKEVDTVE